MGNHKKAKITCLAHFFFPTATFIFLKRYMYLRNRVIATAEKIFLLS